MNFKELKDLNNEIIASTRKALEDNRTNGQLRTKLIINTKIGELLENDEGVFFNISAEDASKIIGEIIENKEQVKKIYMDLTSPEEYKRLRQNYKI